MNCQYMSLFVISFFLYASIYAVHSFMFQILQETGVIDKKKFCLMNLFFFFKCAGVLVFSNLGDRKGIHKYLIAVNVFIYSCTFLVLYNLKRIENLILRRWLVLCSIIVNYSVLAGTFPILDSLIYNYLEAVGLDNRLSGRIRMGGSFGNMFVQIICTIIQKFSEQNSTREEQKQRKNLINIGCNCVFGVLTAITCLLFAPKYSLANKVKLKKKAWNVKKVFSDLTSIFSPILLFYTLAVLGLGIDRAAISNFLSKFLENNGVDRSFIHILLLCRSIPEIAIYGFSQKIEKLIGMNVMFLLAVLVSFFRSLFYSLFDLQKNPGAVRAITVIMEVSKGIYSSLYNYSVLRIFRSFATDEKLSSVQGLCSSTYNAMAYVVFAFLGFFMVDYDTLSTKQSDDDLRRLFFVVAIITSFSIIAPIINIIKIRKSKRKVIEAKLTIDTRSEKIE